MDKEEALHDFIKGLRIVFNNSLAYQRKHPYFIKSVEEFRQKIEVLFGFLNPIKINITPESLFLDNRYWIKPLLYVELAQILHQRKIKSIEFRPGVNTEELASFLSALALSPKDVIKNGGLGGILRKARTAHVSVEELDYSELLNMKGEGEYGDIWRFLFKGAIASRDPNRINKIVDGFSEGLKNIDAKELVSDDGLKQDLINLFCFLKENNKNGFSDCSNALFSYLINSKDALSQEELQSLKVLFSGFSESDFAGILLTQLSKKDNLDPLFLNLFSMFSQGAISSSPESLLPQHISQSGALGKDHLSVNKIQALLSNLDSQSISPVYHNILSSLLKDIAYNDDFEFKPEELSISYRFVLLNMLDQKKDGAGLKFILAKLNEEWPSIVEDKDFEYIRYLLQVVSSKLREENLIIEELNILNDQIAVLIEEILWGESFNADLDYLAGSLEKSRKGSQFYLNKIFQEDKINGYGLRLFLKFFPMELEIFYSGLKSKQHDLEYLGRIIRIIAGLGSDFSLVMLREIYSFSNELVRVEILKAMQALSALDKEFLFNILKGNNRALKKEAFQALLINSESGKDGLAILLRAYSPWGINNKLILENMAIIDELKLKESVSYLEPFTKMNLFWHASLKKKALSMLEGLK